IQVSNYHRKQREHESFNAMQSHLWRGMGVATFHHGAGFTGSGEVALASQMIVAGLPDGRIEVRSANTEMGQGTTTIFLKIASDRMGVDPDDVAIAQPDTAAVPNSGPTVASRTAMVVGHLIEQACDDLKNGLQIGADV